MRHNGPLERAGEGPLRRSTTPAMELTPLNLGIFAALGVTVAGYVTFILVPAVTSYGRLWERVAAGFLSLFILASLVGFGLAIGIGIVVLYDQLGS